jgi:tetratricopeptide (TPR) repeat protein
MSNELDLLERILSEELPPEQVKSLMSKVTIALGAHSVAIAGNVTGSVIIAGNRNKVTFNRETNPKEIVETLTTLLQEVKNLQDEQNQSRKVNASIMIDDIPPHVCYWQPRKIEINTIEKWLEEEVTLIEITGFGGYGKSALVSQISKDRSLNFFNNKIWINFSQPYSFNQIGNWLLSKLNQKTFNLKIDDDIELRNKLINSLNREQILLVLDNLETLVEGIRWIDNSYDSFLTKWQQYGKNSRIIITSRQQHVSSHISSRSLNLKGLEPDIAIELLKQQGIHGVRSDFLDFVREVDGHPLLINFIVGLLKNRFGESADIYYYKRLNINLSQVVGSHREDKKSSVTAIFDNVFNNLNPKLKALVFLLVVHRHPFTFEASRSLSAANNNEILTEEEFEQLSQYSLLQVTSELDREYNHFYTFQPLVKYCIAEKISEVQLQDAHKFAIIYYNNMCMDRKEWKSTNDIFEYLEKFYHYRQIREYQKACETILICDDFLDLHGYSNLLAEYYKDLYFDLSLISDIRFDTSEILLKMGNAYKAIKDFEKAVAYYTTSLQKSIANKNIQIQYRVLNSLASICHDPDIKDSINESIWKILENYFKISHDLPKIYNSSKLMKGDLANKYFELLIKISPDQAIKSKILISLGNTRYLQNRYDKCIDFYEKSLNISSESFQQRETSSSLGNLGNAYFREKEFDLSIKYHNSRLKISQEIGDIKGEINSLFALSILFFIKLKPFKGINCIFRLIDILNETQIPNDSLPLPKWFRIFISKISLSSSKSEAEIKIL